MNNTEPTVSYAGDHFADLSAMLLGLVTLFLALCFLVSTYQRSHSPGENASLQEAL
jgi:hypothetical protein